MKLRDYQDRAVSAVIENIGGDINPLVIAPTGAGKSLIIAAIVNRLTNLQCLVITPRIKLLEQNAALISETGILSGKLGQDNGDLHRVICGTYQTLARRKFKKPDLIIVDEAHLVPDDDSLYSKLLDIFPYSQIVGLTATPFRGKQKIHEGDNRRWTKIFEIDMKTLIDRGFLVPPVPIETRKHYVDDDLSDIDIMRRFIPELAAKLNKLKRNKVIVFCKDIDHSIECARELSTVCDSNWFVSCIHSKQKPETQKRVYSRFQNNKKSILTNCSMLTTGVDLPSVDCIVILRRISSISLYIQIVGRGLRGFPGKKECTVFDFGYNYRYGFIDNPIIEKNDKTGTGNGKITKKCPECDALNTPSSKVCQLCGHEFSFKHILSDHSTSNAIISAKLQISTILETQCTKLNNGSYRLVHKMENGLTAVSFSSIEKKETGRMVIYESLQGTNKIISLI